MPVSFAIHDDARYHPVAWTKHPDLHSIVFSDGSTAIVNPEPDYSKRDTNLDKPDRDPELHPFLKGEGAPTPTYSGEGANTLGGAAGFSDILQEQRLDDAMDELRDTVAEEVAGTQEATGDEVTSYLKGEPTTGGSLLRPATSPLKSFVGLDGKTHTTEELDEEGKRLAQRFKPEGFA